MAILPLITYPAVALPPWPGGRLLPGRRVGQTHLGIFFSPLSFPFPLVELGEVFVGPTHHSTCMFPLIIGLESIEMGVCMQGIHLSQHFLGRVLHPQEIP